MHFPGALATFFLLCTAALASQIQNVSLPTIPSSPPANGSHSLDRALFSFSLELAYLTAFGGNDSAPNELTRALMAQLEKRTGVGPDVRPGGITMSVPADLVL
jgi:hypothetical protein